VQQVWTVVAAEAPVRIDYAIGVVDLETWFALRLPLGVGMVLRGRNPKSTAGQDVTVGTWVHSLRDDRVRRGCHGMAG